MRLISVLVCLFGIQLTAWYPVFAADIKTVSTSIKFTNSYGWSVMYPDNWSITGVANGDSPDEDADHVMITGPKGCWEKIGRCGSFNVEISKRLDNKIPEGTEVFIDGVKGYRTENKPIEENHSLGQPTVWIRVPYGNYDFYLYYFEESPKQNVPADFTDWQYQNVFESLVKSFAFKKK